MLLKACVNGRRGPHEHPALVADPAVAADEAAGALAAGAGAVHVHPKNARGDDSLAPDDVAAWVGAVRQACPGVAVGVTTGHWCAPGVEDRLGLIRGWRPLLPDFASVNWHEDGADDVAALLVQRGVGVEAGIWHAEGLRRWLASPHRGRCLRVLVELPDMPAERVTDEARGLVEPVRAAEPGLPVLLHGEERSTWPALDLAITWELDTRIGLEDSLLMPDGSPARSNADLALAALARRQPT